MHKNPHPLRRLRRIVWYSVAAFIVTLAVLMSLARVLISEVGTYRENIERLASTFLDHPVRIDSLDARVVGLSPTLVFKNVQMMDKSDRFALIGFNEARLGLDVAASLRARRLIPSDFTIKGVELAITRRKDGSFIIYGLNLEALGTPFADKAGYTDEISDWLFQRGRLKIQESTLVWIDQQREGRRLRFDNVNIELWNKDKRHQLTAKVKLPESMGRSLDVALDMSGDMLAPSSWEGKAYVQGNGVHLDKLGVVPKYNDMTLQQGVADFQLWSDWQGGLRKLSGDVTSYNVVLNHPEMKAPLSIRLLGGLFKMRFDAGGWALDVNRFHYMDAEGAWPETHFSVTHNKGDQQRAASTAVKADYFRLEDISTLLMETPILANKQREILTTLLPTGDVHNLQLTYMGSGEQPRFSVSAKFEQLGFNPWQSMPGVRGLNGVLWSNPQQGYLQLDTAYSVLDFPKLFRWPMQLSELSGRIDWQRQAQGWLLSTNAVNAANEDIAFNAGFLLHIPTDKQSPLMDLQVRFNNGNAAHAQRYYPVSIMDDDLVKWLDRSLVSGRVNKGGAVFHGRLADFPFKKGQGQFQVYFEAEDVALDYQEGWPRIRDSALSAEFTGIGMKIDVHEGKIFNSRVSATTVDIEKFRDAVLRVNGQVEGEVQDAAYFLVDSPIQPQAREVVKGFRYEGQSLTRLNLSIPLGPKIKKRAPLGVKGSVEFKDAAVYLLDDLMDITHINGTLDFSEDSQQARGIKAHILGGPASLDVFSRTEVEGHPINLTAKGVMDSRRFIKQFGLPAAKQVSGEAVWHGMMTLPYHSKGQLVPANLSLSSELTGVEITLPQPLQKNAAEARPASLKVRFADQGRTRLMLSYGEVISSILELDVNGKKMRPVRGHLRISAGQAELPQEDEIRISGRLQQFSLAPWMAALEQGSTEVNQSFATTPLVFDMDYIQLAPITEEETAEEKPPSKFNFDMFPPLRVRIAALVYDEAPLGSVQFRTTKQSDGMTLHDLRLEGEKLRLNASGQWKKAADADRSGLDLKLHTPDVGEMLRTLGFAAVIEGGKTDVSGSLSWPGSPIDIGLADMEGTLHVQIKDGAVTSVDPGAGRLLGLFSLSALPRRLILDFSDIFGTGLRFDDIEGDIVFEDGNALMEGMVLDGPLALVTVSGRTGLVAEDFDQLVTVVPQVGDTLPVAGGMIFGPEIGAFILLIEKLFGREIEQASQRQYQVTGTWEEPVITLLGEEPDKAAAPEQEQPQFGEDF